ncbi:hypothetical protein [Chitinimonas sp.]|uniref:hypothetical protein n=1 Tax=Chitinimonas sp. TaxID=1934313 RepID=UPI0035AFEB20
MNEILAWSAASKGVKHSHIEIGRAFATLRGGESRREFFNELLRQDARKALAFKLGSRICARFMP